MFLPSAFKYTYGALAPFDGNGHEEAILNAIAEGFVEANVIQLEALPIDQIPHCIECAHLTYKPPVSCFIQRRGGKTVYDDTCQNVTGAIPLLSLKEETCMGLAIFHAALLRFQGDNRAKAIAQHMGNRYYHMVVRNGHGQILDTSEIVRRGGSHG